MSLNIVLIEPEIPNNTGNIGRLTLASGSTLHLVRPFGFNIDDTRLKRAGLDYWQHLNIKYYDSIEIFFSINKNVNMVFLSSHGNKLHWQIPFEHDMFLVFGKESVGLPKWLIESHPEKIYKIPIMSKYVRSLNLANAVSVVTYEGQRQLSIGTHDL